MNDSYHYEIWRCRKSGKREIRVGGEYEHGVYSTKAKAVAFQKELKSSCYKVFKVKTTYEVVE